MGAGAKESAHEVNMEVCCVPGFQVLQWLLPRHTHIPAIFFLLMKLMLGQHNRELPDDIQVGWCGWDLLDNTQVVKQG